MNISKEYSSTNCYYSLAIVQNTSRNSYSESGSVVYAYRDPNQKPGNDEHR